MKRKYRCRRCGYIWESGRADYCLRCYSKNVRTMRAVRDRISNAFRRSSKSVVSTRNRFSKKFPGFMDYLIDFWTTVRGFLFVILVFILLVLVSLIYFSSFQNV